MRLSSRHDVSVVLCGQWAAAGTWRVAHRAGTGCCLGACRQASGRASRGGAWAAQRARAESRSCLVRARCDLCVACWDRYR